MTVGRAMEQASTAGQRYVSRELTHFVGASCANNMDRYTLFVGIIKQGVLCNARYCPPRGVQPSCAPPLVEYTCAESLVSNLAVMGNYVCFCDIPVGDLALHIAKYGPFGIAFLKDYLVELGVSPVWYVPVGASVSGRTGQKAQQIEELVKGLYLTLGVGENERQQLWLSVMGNILPYLKFFDHTKADADKDNYYMEREWRVVGRVGFELANIERVILPRDYVERFRQDFPKYCGQLSFAD